MDYPKEGSPVSRDHRDQPGWVERFEGIVAGREVCNAFTELVDPDEQRLRFDAQAAAKEAGDEEDAGMDEELVEEFRHSGRPSEQAPPPPPTHPPPPRATPFSSKVGPSRTVIPQR